MDSEVSHLHIEALQEEESRNALLGHQGILKQSLAVEITDGLCGRCGRLGCLRRCQKARLKAAAHRGGPSSCTTCCFIGDHVVLRLVRGGKGVWPTLTLTTKVRTSAETAYTDQSTSK
eukprot:SAG31_NODE_18860_length_620_cov_0.915547_1_plen_117_part_01